MVTLTQLQVSTEPIQIQIAATSEGSVYDPSGDAVAIAFVPITSPPSSPDPTSMEWNTAYWETDSANPGSTYWASILVGPENGGIPLSVGSYLAVVKVTDSPAVPVKQGCYLQIV